MQQPGCVVAARQLLPLTLLPLSRAGGGTRALSLSRTFFVAVRLQSLVATLPLGSRSAGERALWKDGVNARAPLQR